MLFNSVEYLVFFIPIFIIYYLLDSRFRWILLLAASFFFYMSWQPYYILLMCFTILVDYTISHKIYNTDNKIIRKRLITTSLLINLSVLFFFKYFNFFSENIALLFSNLNISYQPIISNLLLPVGISFYTFQSLSYNIDIFRGKLMPEKHIGKYALYISFFPQLVAGPIERAQRLLPQLQKNENRLTYENFASGLAQFIFGLFKKVVVADTLAIYVNSVYNNYEFYTGFTLVVATYFFAFQIYCDFSGYSDMAIGSARMLGYNLMENFKLPYFSKSITEFWRRWHISLSSWLRDYLYISMGGNRKGEFRTLQNLLVTMLLGGLWHGASWNFVIWGALNGIYLSIEKYFKFGIKNRNESIFSRAFFAFITFNLIAITWIFFRAQTIEQSWFIINQIFNSSDFFNFKIFDTSILINIIIGLSLLLIIEFGVMRKHHFNGLVKVKSPIWLATFCIILLFFTCLFGITDGSQFIYFQF